MRISERPPRVIRMLAMVLFGLTLVESNGVAQAPLAPPADVSNTIAVIVNRQNGVDSLSLADLRRIFLLERQSWPNGRKVTVVLREEGQGERAEALGQICEMSPADYSRYVRQQAFRGNTDTNLPRSIRSADGMRRFVFNAPGAIGYVHGDETDDSVKVLRIDGKLPGEPGYRLVIPRSRRGGAPPTP